MSRASLAKAARAIPELAAVQPLVDQVSRRYRALRDTDRDDDAGSITTEYAILIAVIVVVTVAFAAVVIALINRKTDLIRNL